MFRPPCLATLAVAFLIAASLPAQCDLAWQPGPGAPGPNGPVRALAYDAAGDLIAGGRFVYADTAVCNHVARWDGSTWLPIGGGVSGPGNTTEVRAIATLPNGDLVIGGEFTMAGTTPATNIARWDGTSWQALGAGVGANGDVNALLVLPNGDLIAAGYFSSVGGVAAPCAARWDGTSWSPVGPAVFGGATSVALDPAGGIVLGGAFALGGLSLLIRSDGVSWQPVPGFTSGPNAINGLTTLANGTVVVGGSFALAASGPCNLATWDGSALQAMTPPESDPAQAVFGAGNGDLLAKIGYGPSLLRWDGANWTYVPDPPSVVRTMAEDAAGGLLVGSDVLPDFGISHSVRRYDGAAWQDLGIDTSAVAIVRRAGPDAVVVGGLFGELDGVPANNVAIWQGGGWAALGAGVDGMVHGVAPTPDGGVVVSGDFTTAGGVPASGVARWDGQAWSAVAPTPPPLVGDEVLRQCGAADNGDVLVTVGVRGNPSSYRMLRWDGVAWAGLLGPASFLGQLTQLSDGRVAVPTANGLYTYSQGTLAPVPGITGTVIDVTESRSGDLIVLAANALFRFDGVTQTPLPPVPASAIVELPSGDLVACDAVTSLGGGAPSLMFRLVGGGWQSFGDVLGSRCRFLAATESGRLFVAGTAVTAGANLSLGLATAAPTCPATVTPVGAGCVGSAGPVELSVTTPAWIGGALRTTTTGLPPSALAVVAFGLQPANVPLPLSAPGCQLFVVPEFTPLVVPVAGVATHELSLPAAPTLIGVTLRQQVIGVDLGGPAGVSLTGSNAVELAIGALF